MQKFGLNKFNVMDDSQSSSVNNHHYHQHHQPVNDMLPVSNILGHENDNDNKHNSTAFNIVNNNISNYLNHHNNLPTNNNVEEKINSKYYFDYPNDFNKAFDIQNKTNDYLNMLHLSKSMLNESQVNAFINQVLHSKSSGNQTGSTSHDYLSNKNYKKARFLSSNEFFVDSSKAPLSDQVKHMESEKMHNNSYYHRNNSSSDHQIGKIKFFFSQF